VSDFFAQFSRGILRWVAQFSPSPHVNDQATPNHDPIRPCVTSADPQPQRSSSSSSSMPCQVRCGERAPEVPTSSPHDTSALISPPSQVYCPVSPAAEKSQVNVVVSEMRLQWLINWWPSKPRLAAYSSTEMTRAGISKSHAEISVMSSLLSELPLHVGVPVTKRPIVKFATKHPLYGFNLGWA
jgi:hypothetical protein